MSDEGLGFGHGGRGAGAGVEVRFLKTEEHGIDRCAWLGGLLGLLRRTDVQTDGWVGRQIEKRALRSAARWKWAW